MLFGNWTLGLSLTALTMAVHAAGIVFLAFATVRIRVRMESINHFGSGRILAIMICLIGAIGVLLVALHGLEATVWAAAYWWLGALGSPGEAMLYSVDSISTRGASGFLLEHRWRMMGALEAVDGMLLFGISTAYVFAVMQAFWGFMIPRHHRPGRG